MQAKKQYKANVKPTKSHIIISRRRYLKLPKIKYLHFWIIHTFYMKIYNYKNTEKQWKYVMGNEML